MGKPDYPAQPETPAPRRGYVDPAPKSSLSSPDAQDRSRKTAMGVVNPGGFAGILDPVSTTKNLVLGGGTQGLAMGGGSGGGAPAASAPSTTQPAPIASPASPRPRTTTPGSGTRGFRTPQNPSAGYLALLDVMAKRA